MSFRKNTTEEELKEKKKYLTGCKVTILKKIWTCIGPYFLWKSFVNHPKEALLWALKVMLASTSHTWAAKWITNIKTFKRRRRCAFVFNCPDLIWQSTSTSSTFPVKNTAELPLCQCVRSVKTWLPDWQTNIEIVRKCVQRNRKSNLYFRPRE